MTPTPISAERARGILALYHALETDLGHACVADLFGQVRATLDDLENRADANYNLAAHNLATRDAEIMHLHGRIGRLVMDGCLPPNLLPRAAVCVHVGNVEHAGLTDWINAQITPACPHPERCPYTDPGPSPTGNCADVCPGLNAQITPQPEGSAE